MPPEPAAQDSETEELLTEACSRNRSLELHYFNRRGDLFAARTRLLGFDAQHLYLDKPQSIGKQVEFTPGQAVDAFFTSGQRIYTFKSQIEHTQCSIKLNESKTVLGMIISKPARVRRSQRRHDVRVSLDRLTQSYGWIHGVAPNNLNAAPLDALCLSGELANLSAGGCGLNLQIAIGTKVKIGKPMFLRLDIPEIDQELIFVVEVRNAQTNPDGQTSYLGLQFLNWPSQAHLRRTLRPLERLIADLQRTDNQKKIDQN